MGTPDSNNGSDRPSFERGKIPVWFPAGALPFWTALNSDARAHLSYSAFCVGDDLNEFAVRASRYVPSAPPAQRALIQSLLEALRTGNFSNPPRKVSFSGNQPDVSMPHCFLESSRDVWGSLPPEVRAQIVDIVVGSRNHMARILQELTGIVARERNERTRGLILKLQLRAGDAVIMMTGKPAQTAHDRQVEQDRRRLFGK